MPIDKKNYFEKFSLIFVLMCNLMILNGPKTICAVCSMQAACMHTAYIEINFDLNMKYILNTVNLSRIVIFNCRCNFKCPSI